MAGNANMAEIPRHSKAIEWALSDNVCSKDQVVCPYSQSLAVFFTVCLF